jgi:hypothetical protein
VTRRQWICWSEGPASEPALAAPPSGMIPARSLPLRAADAASGAGPHAWHLVLDDHYLDGERVERSGAYVQAPWRYKVIEGASRWIPLDAPDRLNALLLDWLRGLATGGNWPSVTPSHLGAHNEGLCTAEAA